MFMSLHIHLLHLFFCRIYYSEELLHSFISNDVLVSHILPFPIHTTVLEVMCLISAVEFKRVIVNSSSNLYNLLNADFENMEHLRGNNAASVAVSQLV